MDIWPKFTEEELAKIDDIAGRAAHMCVILRTILNNAKGGDWPNANYNFTRAMLTLSDIESDMFRLNNEIAER